MSHNIYDDFKDVQSKKTLCYDKRSAAFIISGRLSQDIYHIRAEEDIKAAIVYGHKEGPDDVLVYTLNENGLLITDYFTYDSVRYMVYENVKLTDDDVSYKKQKAVECNVSFSFNGITYYGYFTSSQRSTNGNDFVGNTAILPDESPLLMLPSSILTIGDRFTIGSKPWKIIEYDDITNTGISYLYLERDYIPKDSEEVVETAPNYIEEEIVFVQDAAQDSTLVLNPMVEYTFTTEDGYFVATPRVELLSRKSTEVTFRVPYGIDSVDITVRISTVDITKTYTVVL